MAKKTGTPKSVEALRHEGSTRTNIPSAEYQPLLDPETESSVTVAYERRNRDLDPQLVWRGKDEQDWSDLVVQAPPLFIQEKVHPKVLIDDLLRQRQAKPPAGGQLDLFADFNGIPEEADKTEFYQHDQNWSNRMILGDSLQVMASLAEREGLRGQVQCIYIDPPYGIKFNSNFQWSTTSKDVKDGKAEHITREPEQVKAFRDTWRDGIHSYLTYLRDRLIVARDLLTDSGSVFVQIGDENVHRVRALMDEVFGEDNCISQIFFQKTGGLTPKAISNIGDHILWYGKKKELLKFRQPFEYLAEPPEDDKYYVWLQLPDSTHRRMNSEERQRSEPLPQGARIFRHGPLMSSGESSTDQAFTFLDKTFKPSKGNHWKTSPSNLEKVADCGHIFMMGNQPAWKLFWDYSPGRKLPNVWLDTQSGGFNESGLYVVQTTVKVVQRCVLMTTDPGDLVLDPTCGSGTTATVAEQWGRRWITIDTSRVALALARARIMGARYPYYLLADSEDGQLKEAEVARTAPTTQPTHGNIRHGFVYERVPHVMLSSIANNAEIDVIWEQFQEKLEPLRTALNAALVGAGLVPAHTPWEEWQIPREADPKWPSDAGKLHAAWWQARIARQQEIDASIAARADFEYLYDKPYEDKKKVRVAGPFTVESLSPHRTLTVDEHDEVVDPAKRTAGSRSFEQMILENLETAGVQQAHKEDHIAFTSLVPWPGDLVCAEGRYREGGGAGPEKRAAIFIGPEFGTVQRADLVSAAREAADAAFDVLIACAFNYEAHATEFDKLGRIPVLKARMNADLHMADTLKNTGKGNLFVIFGEPDVTVTCGPWLVTSQGRMLGNYELIAELSGLGSLVEINRVGRDDLPALRRLSQGGAIRADQPASARGDLRPGEHRGGSGAGRDAGIPAVPGDRERLSGRDGDVSDPGREAGHGRGSGDGTVAGAGGGRWSDAQRSQALAALKALKPSDLPLSLTTDHQTQVTIHGVDVFDPSSGEVRSDGPDGIACWFIDTDYNEESFFVRHAYFLGANDPYKSLKTSLKAEIDAEAWETLHSDTSRPFDKPSSGRIAVKVINHLGDEVMKVFRV